MFVMLAIVAPPAVACRLPCANVFATVLSNVFLNATGLLAAAAIVKLVASRSNLCSAAVIVCPAARFFAATMSAFLTVSLPNIPSSAPPTVLTGFPTPVAPPIPAPINVVIAVSTSIGAS